MVPEAVANPRGAGYRPAGMTGPKVFISTGESSGDLHAANLIRSLRTREPEVTVEGLGGDRMEAAGCKLVRNLLGLAAMWHKTAGSLYKFFPLLSEIDRRFADDPPDCVVILDYPGFNFPLARRCKSRGIPVLYYIPPQMWAWGKFRMGKLRDRVSRVACIFPFEEPMYREAGVPVRYVGHPLMDALAEELASTSTLQAFAGGSPKIGLLPGSRKQEVETLLPVMIATAAGIREKFPGAEFTVSRAHESLAEVMDPHLATETARRLSLKVHPGTSYDIMRQADLVLVASGTATLECALFGVPMIILYHVDWAAAQIAKRMITSPFIGLANVVAGKGVVPEFAPRLPPTSVIIQSAVELLGDPARCAAIRGELAEVRRKLGGAGASDRAAEEVLSLCGESRRRHRTPTRRGTAGAIW